MSQQHFTNLETSKMLKELGVPQDGAEAYWASVVPECGGNGNITLISKKEFESDNIWDEVYASFSVGRLFDELKGCELETFYFKQWHVDGAIMVNDSKRYDFTEIEDTLANCLGQMLGELIRKGIITYKKKGL